MTAPYRLLASKDCGSAIVEILLADAGVAHEIEYLPYLEPGPQRDRLLALNPLGQVPTLILPDGAAMTESAAIALHLADMAPSAAIAPPEGAPERAAFLHLLVFLVAALYPTFTYGDEPARWTDDGAASDRLRATTDAARIGAWRRVEGLVAPDGPWALGGTRSALDAYVAIMTRWRPGAAWFAAETPRLAAIAQAMAALPHVAAVLERNGPSTEL